MRCEDYPCCGHTDGLPCDWTYTPKARAFDEKHFACDHETGYCEAEAVQEQHVYDEDDTQDGVPWCWGCDDYAKCGEYEPDGADHEQWETTTPEDVWLDLD